MRCQDISFNKNALVFLSSNYINWILAHSLCENCTSQHFLTAFVCAFCLEQTLWSVWNFRANFLRTTSFEIFSTMRVLKLSCKLFRRRVLKLFRSCAFQCLELSSKLFQRDWFLIYWNEWLFLLQIDSFNEMTSKVFSAMCCLKLSSKLFQWRKLDHTSMRRLQKRTNRDSMTYWLQIWRRVDL